MCGLRFGTTATIDKPHASERTAAIINIKHAFSELAVAQLTADQRRLTLNGTEPGYLAHLILDRRVGIVTREKFSSIYHPKSSDTVKLLV